MLFIEKHLSLIDTYARKYLSEQRRFFNNETVDHAEGCLVPGDWFWGDSPRFRYAALCRNAGQAFPNGQIAQLVEQAHPNPRVWFSILPATHST